MNCLIQTLDLSTIGFVQALIVELYRRFERNINLITRNVTLYIDDFYETVSWTSIIRRLLRMTEIEF